MTWKQVLCEIDILMDVYTKMININPQHGLFYQGRMAVWAYYRQNVVAKIRRQTSEVHR